jgi:hypothetical protein
VREIMNHRPASLTQIVLEEPLRGLQACFLPPAAPWHAARTASIAKSIANFIAKFWAPAA